MAHCKDNLRKYCSDSTPKLLPLTLTCALLENGSKFALTSKI